MKKLLPIVIMISALQSVLAGSTNVYVEDWGSLKGGASENNANVSTVGWTGVAISQTAGPYMGIYLANGAADAATGLPLPTNTVYFTTLLPHQTNAAMFYTMDSSGAGTGGDASFADITPTQYTNLTLNVEVRGNATDTNYFAVQVGGSWYVCTSYQMPSSGSLSYPVFTNATLVYTNPANVWQNLTIGTTNVTIGSTASLNTSSTITGIGIVQLPTSAGFNYNELTIQAYVPAVTPPTAVKITATAVTPQYAYVGGGAAFEIFAGGTQPLTYFWESNGVPLLTGGRYFGTTNNYFNITNINLNDAGSGIYSVIVTNIAGSATDLDLTLDVSNVPPGLLYAEDFPYVGPSGSGNLSLASVGWVSSASVGTSIGIYQSGGGLGDAFSYSGTATTNLYYTTDTNDVGFSGLPFIDINPNNYPAISFQAQFGAGNAAGQVTGAISVYWAVAVNGNWYCSAKQQVIDLTEQNSFLIYQYGFNPAVTNWNTLTITGTNAVIGSQASSILTGNITGAGLVIAHNNGSGSDMNFQNFEITTNQAVGTAPGIDSASDVPLSVTVASGGGASFGVSASGSSPFTYYWLTNNVLAQNGGRVSGATTPTLTIADLTANDDNMSVDVIVSNSAGTVQVSDVYDAATLNVTNPPVGLLYTEGFPFVGPVPGNYPISSVGWVEAVVNAPNALFQESSESSEGAVFAYYGSPATTVYYTTTASDTNQSGLPFPNIDLAAYGNSLNFSVQIAPQSSASNVTAYVAVQLNNTNWYVSSNPLPMANSVDSATFSPYTMAFNPAAANWDNLTVTASGGLVGSVATSNLKGVMTGAGLVFVTVGTGGTINFTDFALTGTGVGGINLGASPGSLNLSWVGNPAVELQSTTNLLGTWQDVPNTFGAYSLAVPTTGPGTYFRLAP